MLSPSGQEHGEDAETGMFSTEYRAFPQRISCFPQKFKEWLRSACQLAIADLGVTS
ncbi:MAG: hypothetical protein GDA38_09170 [Hormoscilla sp. SP12CHS1]|nr:hypothetical protein [Hormoscilla sp. SP12CHS1]